MRMSNIDGMPPPWHMDLHDAVAILRSDFDAHCAASHAMNPHWRDALWMLRELLVSFRRDGEDETTKVAEVETELLRHWLVVYKKMSGERLP